jgi:hypothetical protein
VHFADASAEVPRERVGVIAVEVVAASDVADDLVVERHWRPWRHATPDDVVVPTLEGDNAAAATANRYWVAVPVLDHGHASRVSAPEAVVDVAA